MWHIRSYRDVSAAKMKFGRKSVVPPHTHAGYTCSYTGYASSLPRNQVPEWSASYINYKGLKKLIKSAAEKDKLSEEADLAGETYLIGSAF